MAANNTPEWVDGKKINEVLFCADFLKTYPMVSLNGTFFTVEGLVSDEKLLKKKTSSQTIHPSDRANP